MLYLTTQEVLRKWTGRIHNCTEKTSVLYRERLFEYAPTQGMPELVQALVKHLTNFHIFTRSENVFVTSGAQQALYILAAMSFAGGGSKVVVEQPTYSVILDVLRLAKAPVIGVRRTARGLDLGELAAIFAQGDIKFFYTMPRYQNPTGFCYDESQKKAILKIAEWYGVYIVEDDYLDSTDRPADKLGRRLVERGLLVSGVDNCYIPAFEHAGGLRLCVCNASDEELRDAVAMIEQELSKLDK